VFANWRPFFFCLGADLIVVAPSGSRFCGWPARTWRRGRLGAVEAANATEAFGILESQPDIVIVISDIDMPPSPNGMELAALVRDRQPVEIILVSGHGKTSIADLPARTVFFPKPYKESEVIAAIRKVAA
jgi:YesN/AraC family two-component response regulator